MRLDTEGTTGDIIVPIERDGRWFLPPGGQTDELITVAVCAELGEVLWGCWLNDGKLLAIMLACDPQVDPVSAMATWDKEAHDEAMTLIHMRVARLGY